MDQLLDQLFAAIVRTGAAAATIVATAAAIVTAAAVLTAATGAATATAATRTAVLGSRCLSLAGVLRLDPTAWRAQLCAALGGRDLTPEERAALPAAPDGPVCG